MAEKQEQLAALKEVLAQIFRDLGRKKKRYLSIEGAAEMLSLTPEAVYQKVLRREIPFSRVKRMIRFDEDKLIQWMEAHHVPTVGEK